MYINNAYSVNLSRTFQETEARGTQTKLNKTQQTKRNEQPFCNVETKNDACMWACDRFLSSCTRTPTDGGSMWASVQKEPPPREPDYNSIEQLFCLPVAEHKDKGAAAPVKKEPKEVWLVNTLQSSSVVHHSQHTQMNVNGMCLNRSLFLDYVHWPEEEPESEYFPEAV